MTDAAQAPDNAAQNQAEESNGGTFTQDDVNKLVGNTRKEARSAAINDLLQKAGAQSIDEVLEGYQGFRTVQEETQTEAERLKQKLEGIQPKAERADKLEETLNGYLEREREGLPNHIITLLDRMDVVDQLAWLNENKGELTPPEQPQRRSPDANRQRARSDDPKEVQAAFLNGLLNTQ